MELFLGNITELFLGGKGGSSTTRSILRKDFFPSKSDRNLRFLYGSDVKITMSLLLCIVWYMIFHWLFPYAVLLFYKSQFQQTNLQFSNKNFECLFITLKYSNSSVFIALVIMIRLPLFYQYLHIFH